MIHRNDSRKNVLEDNRPSYGASKSSILSFNRSMSMGIIFSFMILSLAIALSMDSLIPLGQGGWAEAMRQSVISLFGHPWEESLILRIAFGFGIIIIIMMIGALAGILYASLFSSFFNKIYSFMDNLDGE